MAVSFRLYKTGRPVQNDVAILLVDTQRKRIERMFRSDPLRPVLGNTSLTALEPSILPVDQAAGMGIGITFRVKHSARDFTV